jgi:transposase
MALRKSELSESKQAALLENFVGGAIARCAGSLVEVNKTTAAYYIERLREIIGYSS